MSDAEIITRARRTLRALERALTVRRGRPRPHPVTDADLETLRLAVRRGLAELQLQPATVRARADRDDMARLLASAERQLGV